MIDVIIFKKTIRINDKNKKIEKIIEKSLKIHLQIVLNLV